MSEKLDTTDVVREELDEMPRPQLTDVAILWRSYWEQWQDWANKLMGKLKIAAPSNLVSWGRKGTQKIIDVNVGVLLAEAAALEKLHEENDKLRELLVRWVYGNAATENLSQLCADTVAVIGEQQKPTRFEQVSGALSALMEARDKREKS